MIPKASAPTSNRTNPDTLMDSDHGMNGPRLQVETQPSRQIAGRFAGREVGHHRALCPATRADAQHGFVS